MALRLHGWLILVLLGSENGLAEPAVVAPSASAAEVSAVSGSSPSVHSNSSVNTNPSSNSNSATHSEPAIYGWIETVTFPQAGLQLEAKLDTGAQTSSLDARSIEEFERDDEPWVRFRLEGERQGGTASQWVERPIVRRVKSNCQGDRKQWRQIQCAKAKSATDSSAASPSSYQSVACQHARR